jgi:signal transduction histidine kinase
MARHRELLVPLGRALMAIAVITTAENNPSPSLHGNGLGVTVALLLFVIGLAVCMSERFAEREAATQFALITVVGAAGVVISALQPQGASDLAPSAAVWLALARLPWRRGVVVGVSITLGLAVVNAFDGLSVGEVLASTLLCVLLASMAYFMKQSRESQARTELLLAELHDARDDLAKMAATQERARIASELHDVLAHSLSGAAIQLQGARKLAEREGAEPPLRAAIDRASELVKDGLGDARRAVGALQGERLPTVEELPALIDSFRNDMNVDATVHVEGDARALSAEASLALYRGAQEALTNVARYAPGASTSVLLRYERTQATLCVEDRASATTPHPAAGLIGLGGGHGLDGMRERIERAGGQMLAEPTEQGWRVELRVPMPER